MEQVLRGLVVEPIEVFPGASNCSIFDVPNNIPTGFRHLLKLLDAALALNVYSLSQTHGVVLQLQLGQQVAAGASLDYVPAALARRASSLRGALAAPGQVRNRLDPGWVVFNLVSHHDVTLSLALGRGEVLALF